MKKIIFAVLLSVLGAGVARADDEVKPADKTTLQVVDYALKTEPADMEPRLVTAFLAVDPRSLPKKLRSKAEARQVELSSLIRIHDTKKKGVLVQPAQDCSEKDFVKPLSMSPFFANYEVVTEDELLYVKNKTKCTEIDLGCRFSMLIFFQKGKDRILKINPNDPIMAIVAEARGKGGQGTQFFGIGFTCLRD